MANPIIVHIEAMLATMDAKSLRAVYMMVKTIYDLQSSAKIIVS